MALLISKSCRIRAGIGPAGIAISCRIAAGIVMVLQDLPCPTGFGHVCARFYTFLQDKSYFCRSIRDVSSRIVSNPTGFLQDTCTFPSQMFEFLQESCRTFLRNKLFVVCMEHFWDLLFQLMKPTLYMLRLYFCSV
jgi:hypothetical protein